MSRLVNLASAAVIAASSAVAAAAAVVIVSPHGPELRAARADASLTPGAAQAAEVRAPIQKAADGHFWAVGEVNGRPVRFLVDTGATEVALTPADAQRLGFRTADLHYGYKVVTAGGQTRAASVRLANVTVGGARVPDVDALVIENGLDASLLGMTYLGRLSGFQASHRGLSLQP